MTAKERLQQTLGNARGAAMVARAQAAARNPKVPAPTTFAPPGWKLKTINGTRRAINPQGQNVSYGQYLNAQARMSGFKSHSDYRKRAKNVAIFRTTSAAKAKLKLGSPDLKFLKERLLTPNMKNDPAPGGRLARFLEDIGWREKNATYDVGDTPGVD